MTYHYAGYASVMTGWDIARQANRAAQQAYNRRRVLSSRPATKEPKSTGFREHSDGVRVSIKG
jgi:hypothetical protein